MAQARTGIHYLWKCSATAGACMPQLRHRDPHEAVAASVYIRRHEAFPHDDLHFAVIPFAQADKLDPVRQPARTPGGRKAAGIRVPDPGAPFRAGTCTAATPKRALGRDAAAQHDAAPAEDEAGDGSATRVAVDHNRLAVWAICCQAAHASKTDSFRCGRQEHVRHTIRHTVAATEGAIHAVVSLARPERPRRAW